jgi:hypothetical protein
MDCVISSTENMRETKCRDAGTRPFNKRNGLSNLYIWRTTLTFSQPISNILLPVTIPSAAAACVQRKEILLLLFENKIPIVFTLDDR